MKSKRRGSYLRGRRAAGIVGALAAGAGAGQSASAAVVHQDFNPPEDVAEGLTYSADLGADGVNEFNLAIAINGDFQPIGVKADTFAGTTFTDENGQMQTRPGMAAIIMENGFAANLAPGTLIGPGGIYETPQILTRIQGWDGLDPPPPRTGRIS